jgi:hypothetical protein
METDHVAVKTCLDVEQRDPGLWGPASDIPRCTDIIEGQNYWVF